MEYFKTLYQYIPPETNLDAPIRMMNVAVIKDTIDGDILLRTMFINRASQNIKAVFISIDQIDISNELICTSEYCYQDISVPPLEIFGNKIPVVLNDKARRVSVRITKVVLEDESVWKPSESDRITTDQAQQIGLCDSEIKKYFPDLPFNDEFIRYMWAEYISHHDVDDCYYYEETDEYWMCSCWTPNRLDQTHCCECGDTRSEIKAIYSHENIEKLTQEFSNLYNDSLSKIRNNTKSTDGYDREIVQSLSKYNKFPATIFYTDSQLMWLCPCGQINPSTQEECIHCKRNKVDAKNLTEDNAIKKCSALQKHIEVTKKTKKLAIIAIPIAAAVIAAIITLIILLNTVIIPNANRNHAIDLMDSGQYAEAIKAFEVLDDGIDYTNKITECRYRIAQSLLDDGQFESAIEHFEGLKNYKNSQHKIKECQLRQVQSLLDSYEYSDATRMGRKALSAIDNVPGDIKNQLLYDIALKYIRLDDYVWAMEYLQAITPQTYNNSDQKVAEIQQEYHYQMAEQEIIGYDIIHHLLLADHTVTYKDSEQILYAEIADATRHEQIKIKKIVASKNSDDTGIIDMDNEPVNFLDVYYTYAQSSSNYHGLYNPNGSSRQNGTKNTKYYAIVRFYEDLVVDDSGDKIDSKVYYKNKSDWETKKYACEVNTYVIN